MVFFLWFVVIRTTKGNTIDLKDNDQLQYCIYNNILQFTLSISPYTLNSTLQMSSFSRWKKVELLDLAEKLRLPKITSSARKSDLIALIEDHLNVLNEPLDVEVDYPELKSFYDAIVVKHEQDDDSDDQGSISATVSEESLPENVLDDVQEDTPEAVNDTDNFNTLNFSDNDDDSTFKFGFENYLSDIVVQFKRFNESVQDSLSTIQSINAIFYLIEFYFIVRPLVERQDPTLSITTLLTWISFSFLLPALIGFYVNFIRYDLPTVQIDPMVFHLAKFLISLSILNLQLTASGGQWLVFLKLGLTSWVHHLGQLPLVFGFVGALLTLYIF